MRARPLHLPAFSLVEVLLVLGVIAAMSAFALPAYRAYQIRSDLDNAAQEIVQSLGRARTLSMAGKGDSVWGVLTQDALLFRGTSFLTRDPAHDEQYPVAPTIQVTGLQEVTYSRFTGVPSATGTITLTAISGDHRRIDILLDREGIPVTLDDRLTICHCQSQTPFTKRIPDSAWPGHRKHGDHLGPCTGRVDECSS